MESRYSEVADAEPYQSGDCHMQKSLKNYCLSSKILQVSVFLTTNFLASIELSYCRETVQFEYNILVV